jgi:hypothetical protein
LSVGNVIITKSNVNVQTSIPLSNICLLNLL